MDYVQTVLARIAATKFDEALAPGGLLSELDAHRDFVAGQPGSRGMSVTRSANPEGDVLVVVETRWATNNALADYSASEPNAASIVNQHKNVLTSDGVQVHRMQSDQTTTGAAPSRVYDRMALALFVPVGVLAFALLIIYGLSRVYLTLPSEWATPLAAGIALGILGISWYFASHPAVPRWQIIGVFVVALGTLGVAGTAAAVYDNRHAEVKKVAAPTPAAAGTPSGNPLIEMADFEFLNASGAKNPTYDITAGTAITFDIKNTGQSVHNVHVSNASGAYAEAICTAKSTDPCSKPASVSGSGTGTIVLNLAAGTYKYRCDFHPTQMDGTIVVK
ncbi:MAG TPA: cupredoxin domain-containing protein [Dehalococcoidia bacterium]|nr:cupredoxin domain-containing protein [Dehalococcoidia bacterium]